MTLAEYFNQTDPQRMPTVMLQKGEYINHGTIKFGQDELTSIEIKGLWERFGIGSSYLQINNSPCLYTTDSDGNKKQLSCFRIMPELSNIAVEYGKENKAWSEIGYNH